MDLTKDNGHLYFIKYLDSGDAQIDHRSRAQAAFILAVLCNGHPKAQALCASAGLLAVCLKWLRALLPTAQLGGATRLLLTWLCLCMGKMCENMPEIIALTLREGQYCLSLSKLTVTANGHHTDAAAQACMWLPLILSPARNE